MLLCRERHAARARKRQLKIADHIPACRGGSQTRRYVTGTRTIASRVHKPYALSTHYADDHRERARFDNPAG